MSYRVEYTDRARKDFNRLDRSLQKRIDARLDELERNPRDSRISAPLRGEGDLQKSRVGGWRVVFKIDDESRIVSLITIERRGQAYKRL